MCLSSNFRTAAQAYFNPESRRVILDGTEEKVNDNKNVERKLQMRKPNKNKHKMNMGGSMSKGKSSHYYYEMPPEPVLDCFFVFKYDDLVAFQVENGEVLEYQQIQNDDDANIAICKGNNCAGEPTEIVGVASGRCNAMESVLEFTVATDEDPQFLDFEVFCPDVLWVGGGECVAIDILTEAPLEFNPVVNVIGPQVTITEIEFRSLVRCRIVCTPRL